MVNMVCGTLPDLLAEFLDCHGVCMEKDAGSIDFSMLIENILSGGEEDRDETDENAEESLSPCMGLLLSNIINTDGPIPGSEVNEGSFLNAPAGKSSEAALQITGSYGVYGGEPGPPVPKDILDAQAEKLLQAMEPAQSEELAQSEKPDLKDINTIVTKGIADCKAKQDTDRVTAYKTRQEGLKDMVLTDNTLPKQNKASRTGDAAKDKQVALQISSEGNMTNDGIYIKSTLAKQPSYDSLSESSEKDGYRNDEYEVGEKSITFKFDTAVRYDGINTFDNKVFIHQADKLTRLVKNEIIDSLTYTQKNTSKKIEIKLEPEFLGKLTIKLERTADEINVKILTSSLNVKEILSDQALKMVESIKNWGVDADIDVVYTGTSGDNNDTRGNFNYNAPGKNSGKAIASELFEGDAFQPLPEQIDKMLYYYSNAVNCLI